MANYAYSFASTATAPTTFAVGDSGITGVDENGTITPKVIKLRASAHVLVTGTLTVAELCQAMMAYCQPRGYGNAVGGPKEPLSHDGSTSPAETVLEALA